MRHLVANEPPQPKSPSKRPVALKQGKLIPAVDFMDMNKTMINFGNKGGDSGANAND